MTSDSSAGQPNLIDEPGVTHTLRATLVAILACSLAISALTLFLKWRLVPQFGLLIAASSAAALVLSRSGRIRPAMVLVMLTIAYTVMHSAATGDGIQSIGLAVIPVLIVVGSLLLDRLLFALFTAAVILAAGGMLAIRYVVLRAERYSSNDLGDFFIFSLTCAVSALVGQLLSTQIQDGFRRIRAGEARYRRIFDNVQDVYFEMRTDGTLLEVSPAGAALFGAPREKMIGCPLVPAFVSRPEFDALLAVIRERTQVWNRELAVRNSRGTLVQVLVNASLQAGPETGGETVIGSIRDITERKRGEQAVRDSEARSRLALDAAGAGTFDFYPQSGILVWSDITKSHFGMSPETEVDHDMFLRAVHPDDRERVRQAGNAAALPSGGGQLAIEYRTIGVEDGKERWLAVRGRMQFDDQNRPVRLIGTTLDITGRRRLEEELRRRAEEFQTIMDVAPVALFVAHDPECRQVTTNRTANVMLELAPDANSLTAPGGPAPPCTFLRDGVEVPLPELPLQTAARGAEVRDSELEALLPSGTRKFLWGHSSPLRDASGNVRGAIAAVQDVTQTRQRTHALLRESEERFRDTADAAPVIIWFSDARKRLTFVNKQMVLFTGIPAEQLLGDGWEQVLHPDDLSAARAVYYEGVDRRAGYQLEYRARRADGEYRQMLGTTSPRYVGREYAGQVGSVIDITDLKRQQQQNLSRQKLESLGVLAAGIAHDFNNLLGSITANAELAVSELAPGSTAAAGIESIKSVADRAAGIVRLLMDYAGQEPVTADVVDLSRLVAEMLDLLRVSVPRHVSLEADLGENLAAVHANPAQIRQVILNLVTNAADAIGADRQGSISVVVSRARLNSATDTEGGSKLSAGDYVRLVVSDTGSGMTQEVQTRIFDPFYTTKSTGRGLGLSAVQGIVRAHHGAISVVSAPGHGTRFEVLLPSAGGVAPAAGAAEAAAVRESASIRGSVLVVEDEEMLRVAVCKMLRRLGFSVFEAGDGCAAIALVRERQKDIRVILLDMTIPGSPSQEVALEARRFRPDIRLILTTAYSREKATAWSADIPLSGYLRKPYRIEDLVRMLREHLAA